MKLNQIFNNSKEEIKKTNWLTYLLFLIIGMLIGAILSSYILYIANNLSDGSKQGNELKELLKTNIAKELETDTDDIQMNVLFQGKTEPLYNEDIIVTCGMYKKGDGVSLGDNEQFNGRFIIIFEKKQRNFLNFLFSTEAEYIDTYAATCENKWFDNKIFYNTAFNLFDVDNNGSNELILGFTSNYADRVSECTVILSRNESGWNILIPNFNTSLNDVATQDNDVIGLLIDEFDIIENGNKKVIYSFPYGGYLLWGENPIDKKRKACAKVALLKKDEDYTEEHEYAYFMYNYNETMLSEDTIWNQGKPLISKEIINEDDLFIEERWGHKVNNTVFYTLEELM